MPPSRIRRLECPEPGIVIYDHLPVTDNDDRATARIQGAFSAEFGEGHRVMTPMADSEDFSIVPQAFPVNCSPDFAPLLQPTLDTGTRAFVVGALAWLSVDP